MIARPAAVLLDMDGTLVDSDAAVESAWSAWALEAGVDPGEVLAFCHGQQVAATIRRFRPDLPDDAVEATVVRQLDRECTDLAGVRAADGATELLRRLDAHDVPWAVVTNSPLRLATARLGAADIRPTTLVSLDDIARGKPAPDGYLLAARRLGVDPRDALAVEDSASGLAAARAAGCRTAAVGGLTGADHDLPGLPELLALLPAELRS